MEISEWLSKNSADLAIFTSPASIFYLIGYDADPHERVMMYIVPKEGDAFLFVPALEVNRAKNTLGNLAVYGYDDNEDPYALIVQHIKEHSSKNNAVSVEFSHMTYGAYNGLHKHLPFEVTADLTQYMNKARLNKSQDEVDKLNESGDLADEMVRFARTQLRVGITEKELVHLVENHMRDLGVQEFSFPMMALFGDHAADPHGENSDRALKDNEWVLMDLGVMCKGYASDMTRMTFFSTEENPEIIDRELYDLVKKAHDEAVKAAKIGMTAHELDAIARNIIAEAGYGDYFIHRLGHGIGQSCHEFPSIVGGNDMVLEEGMCFSIEPGIYMPNRFGARVEDCGVLTKEGYKPFTSSPYASDLIN
ncbi:Xaa-Pro peptidase family protein [Atopobacter sp. AH10]|uniref:M24 family metallopeptidase n=1 Tax=Atopobacter sp. AH10 TaxID=2315861 RepID=UPI001313E8E6|nr:Xaa-Pro peptidase family protein [Atopobacter sp. AH10]